MIGDLITLPLRLSLRTASLFLRGGEEVLKRALALTGRSFETEPRHRTPEEDDLYDRHTTPSPSTAATPAPPPTVQPAPAPTVQPAPAPTAEAAPAPMADPEPPQSETPLAMPGPLVEEPTHVSEEPTIVGELAEPGAEDGAGAQVTIDEPWDGYRRMSAKEVIARVSHSDSAELAAVSLYESAHQARQTVLSAVERQLALAQRSGTSN